MLIEKKLVKSGNSRDYKTKLNIYTQSSCYSVILTEDRAEDIDLLRTLFDFT